MDLDLRGRCAIVTGASKGIGAAIATALAAEGAELVLVSRNRQKLDELAESLRSEHRTRVDVVAEDLSTEAGRQQLVDGIDRVDILVNNAGAIPPGSLLDVDEETWRRAWDLKVYGYIFLAKALYPKITRSGSGVILNVIGAASEDLPYDYLAGAVGNSSLVAFTKALAKTAWRDGVRVVGINPGPVATDRYVLMLRAKAAEKLGDAQRWAELVGALPFGRAATPEEIADAAAFLVSPRSAYTSGTILTINGGGSS